MERIANTTPALQAKIRVLSNILCVLIIIWKTRTKCVLAAFINFLIKHDVVVERFLILVAFKQMSKYFKTTNFINCLTLDSLTTLMLLFLYTGLSVHSEPLGSRHVEWYLYS